MSVCMYACMSTHTDTCVCVPCFTYYMPSTSSWPYLRSRRVHSPFYFAWPQIADAESEPELRSCWPVRAIGFRTPGLEKALNLNKNLGGPFPEKKYCLTTSRFLKSHLWKIAGRCRGRPWSPKWLKTWPGPQKIPQSLIGLKKKSIQLPWGTRRLLNPFIHSFL